MVELLRSDYVVTLNDQVHPIVQMLFPNNNVILQDDNLTINTVLVRGA
jgi:hypothetical protein